MRCDFRTCSGNSHLLRNECVAAGRLLARPHRSSAAPYQKRLGKCQRFPGAKSRPWHLQLSSSWDRSATSPWVYLRGITEVGIPALIPFRDRIAGTHDRRSAGAGADAAVGLGARLHRDVGGARDRHPPRRIRARGAAAYRGDTINSRRLDRLAEAAPQRGMTVSTGGRGNVRARAFTGEDLNIRVFTGVVPSIELLVQLLSTSK